MIPLLKSKGIQRLLRILIACLGAGLGMAIALGGLQLYRWMNPEGAIASVYPVIAYIAMAALFGLIFYLLADRMIHFFVVACGRLEVYLDKLSTPQLTSGILGLLAGMAIAALLTLMLSQLGTSVFTTAFSAIMYVTLGVTGFSVGRRRGAGKPRTLRRKYARVVEHAATRPKMLDASVIIDGRVMDIARTGFLEGDLVIPCFVVEELRRLAESSDAARRARGKRGLDLIARMQRSELLTIRMDETDYPEVTDAEVKLLRLAKEKNAAIVTGDQALNKVAIISGVPVLNLTELTNALRPVVLPGEDMTVQVVKEGKEAGQGVGYLHDGTMIVVDGGREHMGKTVTVTVTSALQTSAGRMIFTRVKENSGKN